MNSGCERWLISAPSFSLQRVHQGVQRFLRGEQRARRGAAAREEELAWRAEMAAVGDGVGDCREALRGSVFMH